MSKIVIITDAWIPQVNGVVVCIQQTVKHLRAMGHDVFVIGPDRFKNIPCPTYPEIRLALFARIKVFAILDDLKPDALHINTEGPLGIAARSYAHKNKMRYTTAFQTRFPEYIKARTAIPLSWTYAFLRWFHKNSERVLVPSKTVQEDLIKWNVGKPEVWSLGVDLSTFRPKKRTARKKKVYVCTSRLAIEKNLDAFLGLRLNGEKWMIGSGPEEKRLREKYPDVKFFGNKRHEEIAKIYQDCDYFVFPSKTDTFGLVLLEAMASGLPVAAYNVSGPKDVIGKSKAGILREDLAEAVRGLESLSASTAVKHAKKFSWEKASENFFSYLHIG
ncbi:glycosyltransferase family 1 protein [Paracoccaceae bacterium]|nr:glycosyltransferase family 1 protein [Paracoccaceae bacterium]